MPGCAARSWPLLTLHLRLGHPGEDVVVAADVGHGAITAAGITVAGLAVPLLLRQARQHLLHIQPLVGVQPFSLGQLACIFQMAAADVVGGQGELRCGPAPRYSRASCHAPAPGTIPWMLCTGSRRLVTPLLHCAGSASSSVAHAGLGGGFRLPVGFLVADRSHAGASRCHVPWRFHGRPFITWQTLLQELRRRHRRRRASTSTWP